MQQSGFDAVISGVLDRDGIVCGGDGAGGHRALPPPGRFRLLDDPERLALHFAYNVVREGLNLIDFAIFQHYPSYPEAATAGRCARYFATHGQPCKAWGGGEAIVWTGARAGATAELRRIA